MNLNVTKKLLAEVLAGRLPDEAAARTARAEIAEAEKAPVLVEVPEVPEPLQNKITADQAILVLGDLFRVFEGTLVSLRENAKARVVIDSAAADSMIRARALLQKAGYETVAHRPLEPLRFLPLMTPVKKP